MSSTSTGLSPIGPVPRQWLVPNFEIFGSDAKEVERDKAKLADMESRAVRVDQLVNAMEARIEEEGGRPNLEALRNAVRGANRSHRDAVGVLRGADKDLKVLAAAPGRLSSEQKHLWRALMAVTPEEAAGMGGEMTEMLNELGARAAAGDGGAAALLAGWSSYHEQNATFAVAVAGSYNAVNEAMGALQMARGQLAHGEEVQELVDELENVLIPEIGKTAKAIEAWKKEIVQDLKTAITVLQRRESRNLGRQADKEAEIAQINARIQELLQRRTETQEDRTRLEADRNRLIEERQRLEQDLGARTSGN